MLSTPSSSHRHRPPPSERRDRHRQHTDQPPIQPAYEPPIAPLNTTGQQALAALLQTNSLRHLKTHLQHAGEKLTDSAGEVNERLTEARGRYEKEKRKKRARENDHENHGEGDSRSPTVAPDNANEELARLTRTEGKVKDVTALLEEKMRGIVDAEVKVDGLTGVLVELGREAEQASVSGNRPSQRRRRGMRRVNEDGEEDDDEEEEDEDYEATPEREARAREIAPSRRLDEKLKDDFANWENLSLTQRYSTHNSYIGFYRIVHDAKHPGEDIPPLPHASTWFNHMEDPTSTSSTTTTSNRPNRRTRRDPSPADSDEIAIERERISLKCPLTLLNYRDPVTSTKCPHSFEREAIFGMIAQSPSTIPDPAGGRNRRVKTVKCPVCSVVLTAEDLRGDPVLLRRVRRAEAAERQEEEEDDDEDGSQDRPRRTKGSRKSGITVASDDEEEEEEDADDMDVDGDSGTERAQSSQQQIRIKQERAISRGLSTAPDMMDDDED
ncbi:hypothetical protein ASPWEDRAFT_46083 [Aspergillus wentii DTO 134E9]|uniref:SP-RING-type domain-containing protein n=1 Tax=Aspergillus wentii DTO 134E9 TaxID=1073089 RepID=A0A1L9R6E0_ASPWE|nr:uncharacterized protein ASPWEDRAFT_46083 [Aspergillus wentii DTO 134E9]KAI9926851.1 hypothetical protein MW887_003948 [Aspergillus wentii]OJJ30479.1 hypothetical protein ASPWEDRAFT_46083 [Aspergillus wentii DTO 134E9]